MNKNDYYIITITDVENILSFGKKETQGAKENYVEEERAKAELDVFINTLKKKLGENIISINDEKTKDEILIERFIFEKSGAYMRIIMQTPLTIAIYCSNKRFSEKMLHSIKKTFHNLIKTENQTLKELFINNIVIDKGENINDLSINKWGKMHSITLRKSIVFTIVAVILIMFCQGLEQTVQYASLIYFEKDVGNGLLANIISAIVIALSLKPLEDKIDDVIGKHI